jgi:hypothetical protein
MGAVLKPFDRMRRTRNRSEYPSFTTPEVTADNVQADLGIASSIELNQQVAEVYAAVDGVYQAAEQGQSTSQYQHARQELSGLHVFWDGKSIGVIPDPTVINAYKELVMAEQERLPNAELGTARLRELSNGDKDVAPVSFVASG